MTWEYRLVKYHTKYDTSLNMTEIYYDNNGKINGYSDTKVIGCDKKDVLNCLNDMINALNKPIINFEDLPHEYNIKGVNKK